ncbi:MAG: response regulator transcription factor [Caldilineaceae bacterium]|nr:response regulator transcription factor [Caldilineaceae bacterium]
MRDEIIRILIVDDHPVVREGLRGLLSFKPGFEVIGEAEDGDEAVQQAAALKPDVIVMDLEMPRQNGLEAARAILADAPNARILLLTSFARDQRIFTCLDSGVLGCLLKDSAPQELFRAIRDVHRGQLALHPAIARRVLQRRQMTQSEENPQGLTEREIEVLRLIARGLSNQEIADELVISLPTVRTHVNHILSKLSLENRSQAILYALRHDIASLDDLCP